MKKILLPIILLLILSCQSTEENGPLMTKSKKKQPVFIINSNRHLNIAEFWINKLNEPNRVIMNQKEIHKFNDTISKAGFVNYFKEIKRYSNSEEIKEMIVESFNRLENKVKYFDDNRKIPFKFYKKINDKLNLSELDTKKLKTRYALIVNYTNQRIIPTEKVMIKKKNQIYFDRNQNSALDIGTAVAILHTSRDGYWHYAIGPTSFGWVRDKDIAFGDRDEILEYVSAIKFIVTTSTKTPILINGVYHDYVRMGVKFPYIRSMDEMMMVKIPTRGDKGELKLSKAMVKRSNVHIGYLKYTQKNILTQAFKFLHLPYGWGGMFGEQDCSKFIQEVFATTGLRLPRNSSSQSNVGDSKIELFNVSTKERISKVDKWAKAGETLFHLPGHIVLYIGEYEGEPFIIHTIWGESSKHFALGRTAVTSLKFHNYIDKIDRITTIK